MRGYVASLHGFIPRLLRQLSHQWVEVGFRTFVGDISELSLVHLGANFGLNKANEEIRNQESLMK